MEIFVIRHGETNYNVKHLHNSDPSKNVHFTEKGKKQVKEASLKLKNKKLDLIIVSDFPRTKQTAEIINKYHNVQIKVDARINEVKRGFEFENKRGELFTASIKKAPNRWNFKFDGGESFEDEKTRVKLFIDDLKKLKEKTILIVTHQEIIRIINGLLKNLSNEEMLNLHVGNCDIFNYHLSHGKQ